MGAVRLDVEQRGVLDEIGAGGGKALIVDGDDAHQVHPDRFGHADRASGNKPISRGSPVSAATSACPDLGRRAVTGRGAPASSDATRHHTPAPSMGGQPAPRLQDRPVPAHAELNNQPEPRILERSTAAAQGAAKVRQDDAPKRAPNDGRSRSRSDTEPGSSGASRTSPFRRDSQLAYRRLIDEWCRQLDGSEVDLERNDQLRADRQFSAPCLGHQPGPR